MGYRHIDRILLLPESHPVAQCLCNWIKEHHWNPNTVSHRLSLRLSEKPWPPSIYLSQKTLNSDQHANWQKLNSRLNSFQLRFVCQHNFPSNDINRGSCKDQRVRLKTCCFSRNRGSFLLLYPGWNDPFDHAKLSVEIVFYY